MVASIIQARMSSTRLPGKILKYIAGRPMLAHVIERAAESKRSDMTLVATTVSATDDPVVDFCKTMEIPFFRGDEADVLDRYYQAAKHFQVDVIVRLTADCPLLDPEVIDKILETYLEGDFDYVSNTIERTYPDGLDTEVMRFKALETAWREAEWLSEREHVTPYIYKHPEKFRIAQVQDERDNSGYRWTVDESADLEFVREIHRLIGSRHFSRYDVFKLLEESPGLVSGNKNIPLNEGYQQSIQNDSLAPER